MPIDRLRRALLISVTVLTMLLAVPNATIARGAHQSSTPKTANCRSTSAPHKGAVRKCAKPAHKAKPRHATHHPAHSRHKHKAKHPTTGTEEAEEEGEAMCEEGTVEASSESESGAVCEAPAEEQES